MSDALMLLPAAGPRLLSDGMRGGNLSPLDTRARNLSIDESGDQEGVGWQWSVAGYQEHMIEGPVTPTSRISEYSASGMELRPSRKGSLVDIYA